MRTNENENSLNPKGVFDEGRMGDEEFEGTYVAARVLDDDSVVRIIDLDDLDEAREQLEGRQVIFELYNGSPEDDELFGEIVDMDYQILRLWFEKIVDMSDTEKAALYFLISDRRCDLESALFYLEDCVVREGDIEDIAYDLFDEHYGHEVPEHLRQWIDHIAFAEEMAMGGVIREFEFGDHFYTCCNAADL